MANRGTSFLKQWERNLIAERESVVVTSRCAFCDWTQEGTVAETRDAYLAHRTENHPEIQPKPRRHRQRPSGQMTTGKNLDDNIAAARKTGAATWAGQA